MGIGHGNDLEWAAERLQPELHRLRRAAARAGYPGIRMTGSGSTLFVALDDQQAAEQCRRRLAAAMGSGTGGGGEPAFVVTRSGPGMDVDQPTAEVPSGLPPHPPDAGH